MSSEPNRPKVATGDGGRIGEIAHIGVSSPSSVIADIAPTHTPVACARTTRNTAGHNRYRGARTRASPGPRRRSPAASCTRAEPGFRRRQYSASACGRTLHCRRADATAWANQPASARPCMAHAEARPPRSVVATSSAVSTSTRAAIPCSTCGAAALQGQRRAGARLVKMPKIGHAPHAAARARRGAGRCRSGLYRRGTRHAEGSSEPRGHGCAPCCSAEHRRCAPCAPTAS